MCPASQISFFFSMRRKGLCRIGGLKALDFPIMETVSEGVL